MPDPPQEIYQTDTPVPWFDDLKPRRLGVDNLKTTVTMEGPDATAVETGAHDWRAWTARWKRLRLMKWGVIYDYATADTGTSTKPDPRERRYRERIKEWTRQGRLLWARRIDFSHTKTPLRVLACEVIRANDPTKAREFVDESLKLPVESIDLEAYAELKATLQKKGGHIEAAKRLVPLTTSKKQEPALRLAAAVVAVLRAIRPVLVVHLDWPFPDELANDVDKIPGSWDSKILEVVRPQDVAVVVDREYRRANGNGALRAADALWEIIKRRYLGIRVRQIRNILRRMGSLVSSSIVKRVNTGTHESRSVDAGDGQQAWRPNQRWVIDLAHMSPPPNNSEESRRLNRANAPHKYMLFAIDTATRFVVCAEPLQDQTMRTIIGKLALAIARYDTPKIIQSDNQMNTAAFKTWLTSLTRGDGTPVVYSYGRPYQHTAQSLVECLIRRFRVGFSRWCVETGDWSWVRYAPVFQSSENKSVNGSLRYRPVDLYIAGRSNYKVANERRLQRLKDRDLKGAGRAANQHREAYKKGTRVRVWLAELSSGALPELRHRHKGVDRRTWSEPGVVVAAARDTYVVAIPTRQTHMGQSDRIRDTLVEVPHTAVIKATDTIPPLHQTHTHPSVLAEPPSSVADVRYISDATPGATGVWKPRTFAAVFFDSTMLEWQEALYRLHLNLQNHDAKKVAVKFLHRENGRRLKIVEYDWGDEWPSKIMDLVSRAPSQVTTTRLLYVRARLLAAGDPRRLADGEQERRRLVEARCGNPSVEIARYDSRASTGASREDQTVHNERGNDVDVSNSYRFRPATLLDYGGAGGDAYERFAFFFEVLGASVVVSDDLDLRQWDSGVDGITAVWVRGTRDTAAQEFRREQDGTWRAWTGARPPVIAGGPAMVTRVAVDGYVVRRPRDRTRLRGMRGVSWSNPIVGGARGETSDDPAQCIGLLPPSMVDVRCSQDAWRSQDDSGVCASMVGPGAVGATVVVDGRPGVIAEYTDAHTWHNTESTAAYRIVDDDDGEGASGRWVSVDRVTIRDHAQSTERREWFVVYRRRPLVTKPVSCDSPPACLSGGVRMQTKLGRFQRLVQLNKDARAAAGRDPEDYYEHADCSAPAVELDLIDYLQGTTKTKSKRKTVADRLDVRSTGKRRLINNGFNKAPTLRPSPETNNDLSRHAKDKTTTGGCLLIGAPRAFVAFDDDINALNLRYDLVGSKDRLSTLDLEFHARRACRRALIWSRLMDVPYEYCSLYKYDVAWTARALRALQVGDLVHIRTTKGTSEMAHQITRIENNTYELDKPGDKLDNGARTRYSATDLVRPLVDPSIPDCAYYGVSFFLFVFLYGISIMPARWLIGDPRKGTMLPVHASGRWLLKASGDDMTLFVELHYAMIGVDEFRGNAREGPGRAVGDGVLTAAAHRRNKEDRRGKNHRVWVEINSLLASYTIPSKSEKRHPRVTHLYDPTSPRDDYRLARTKGVIGDATAREGLVLLPT